MSGRIVCFSIQMAGEWPLHDKHANFWLCMVWRPGAFGAAPDHRRSGPPADPTETARAGAVGAHVALRSAAQIGAGRESDAPSAGLRPEPARSGGRLPEFAVLGRRTGRIIVPLGSKAMQIQGIRVVFGGRRSLETYVNPLEMVDQAGCVG